MYGEPFKRVDMPERIERDIAEHEVFLSFYDDIGAEAFHEWWEEEGSARFREWCEKNPDYVSAILD